MWEEHPEYQKSQMRFIGIGVALLVAIYIVFAVSNRDWDLLWQILLFVGAFACVIGLFSGGAWLLVRLLTKKRHTDDTKIERSHDASYEGSSVKR